MTVRINKQKINLREKLTEFEDKVNFDEVVRGLGENTSSLLLNKDGGNVGIGTTNPNSKLKVVGDSAADFTALILANNYATDTAGDVVELMFQHHRSYSDPAALNDSAFVKAVKEVAWDSNENRKSALTFGTRLGSIEPAEKMRITSSGNVGIGTTSPGAKLDVRLGATGTIAEFRGADTDLLHIDGDANGISLDARNVGLFNLKMQGSEVISIDSDGNVGIGTTNPDDLLTLGTADSGTSVISFRTDSNARISEIKAVDTGSGDGQLSLWTRKTGTSYQRITIDSDGNVGIGTTNPARLLHLKNSNSSIAFETPIDANGSAYAQIKSGRDGSSGYSSTLEFATTESTTAVGTFGSNGTGGSGFVTRMLIDSAGNVGIGTTNPNYLLDVQTTDSYLSQNLKINKSSSSSNHIDLAFQLWSGAGTGEHVFGSEDYTSRPSAVIRAKSVDSAAKGDLIFATFSGGANNSTLTEKMIIRYNGNVGIGTTNPGAKLHANYWIQATGTVTVSAGSDAVTGINTLFTIEFAKNDTIKINGEIKTVSTIISDTSLTLSANHEGGATNSDAYKTSNSLWVGNVTEGYSGAGKLGSMVVDYNGASNIALTNSKNDAYTYMSHNGDRFKIQNSYAISAGKTPISLSASGGDDIFIKTDGNVGIGTTSPGSYKLSVNGTAYFNNTITVVTTNYTSDDRVKHNEQPIIGALETLSKITPKKYIKTTEMYDADHDFELDADGNPIDSNGEPVEYRIEAGVIAQQVLTVDELAFAVSPEGVDEDGIVTSPYGLDYNSLFTYAIAAIQEQQTIINDLKSRIETLEQQ